MSEIKYYVKEKGKNRCTEFNNRTQAFQYAESVNSKTIYMSLPDQVDWYLWDWNTERWIYP